MLRQLRRCRGPGPSRDPTSAARLEGRRDRRLTRELRDAGAHEAAGPLTSVPLFVRFGTAFERSKVRDDFIGAFAAGQLEDAGRSETADAVTRLANNQVLRSVVVAAPVVVLIGITTPSAFVWNWLL